MNDEQPVAVKRFKLGWWTPLGGVMLIVSVVMLMNKPPVSKTIVDRVRISESATLAHPGGAAESVIEKLKRAAAHPDYYLHIFADTGEQITDIKPDTPIGNGLTFNLKTPVPLAQLREVQVKHDGWLGDSIIDRVDVTHLSETGQLFTFIMLSKVEADAPQNWQPIAIWISLGLGGLLVLSTFVRFVAQQVI